MKACLIERLAIASKSYKTLLIFETIQMVKYFSVCVNVLTCLYVYGRHVKLFGFNSLL